MRVFVFDVYILTEQRNGLGFNPALNGNKSFELNLVGYEFK